ncbi:biotin-dependent carboxyltransferase family protein [Coraliomargarita parva]|uniref:5-oxoprolinase subunit C family protein n=1 Tax=Coraliomargarita parva TaxID=3014050 RepID=UPI0022B54FE1|nr:biotin-dependent carboxyltransferase family protein [Coraliomargarita parva]
MPEPCIEILATGAGASLQDAGRPGWRRFGVPPGGVLDRYSAEHANRLVGNAPHAPVLEIIQQGFRLRALRDVWIGLAGADHCSGLASWTAAEIQAGAELVFDQPGTGLCSYLAVPGGFFAPRYFSSVSVDPRTGLGESVCAGMTLASMKSAPLWDDGRVAGRILSPELVRKFAKQVSLGLYPGPQYDSFDEAGRDAMTQAVWTVSRRSDRTGFRLEGPTLMVPPSIPSEPVLPGSIQVPGNGQPIITLNDGPTVGGYSKIAVIPEQELDWLVQCAPGTQIRFSWVHSY